MLPLLDSLLSLPFLSFLLLPTSYTLTSFTTSLNLLFFYMTWATVVLSQKPLFIEFWGTLAVRVVFYLAPCSLFLLFDTLLPGVSASIKAYSTRALPLGGAVRRGSRVSAAARRQRLLCIVCVSIFNTILGVLAQTAIELAYTSVASEIRYRTSSQSSLAALSSLIAGRSKPQTAMLLAITTTLPLPWTILRDLARLYVARAVLSYYTHRFILHNSSVAPPVVASLHAKWQHQLRLTIPFSAAYDHPIPFLFHTWLPSFLPSAFFRVHFLTYLLFIALVSLEEALAWSGYIVLPLGVLLSGTARRTEKHLLSGGEGNFAPYGLLDWLHGTALAGRDVLDDVREEMHRRDVRGKVKRAARQAGERLWSSSSNSGSDDDDDVGDGSSFSKEEEDDVDEYKGRSRRVAAPAQRRRRKRGGEEGGAEEAAYQEEADGAGERSRRKKTSSRRSKNAESDTSSRVKKVLKNALRGNS